MFRRCTPRFVWLAFVPALHAHAEAPADLREAVTLYASFDEQVRADRGAGERTPRTRFDHPQEKGRYLFEEGIDEKTFRIAPEKGIHGGALEAVGVLPRRGRIFFPAKGNLAYQRGGWGGAVSVWINTDPNTMLKTSFCDPVQITEKGANDGGIWFDFPDTRPRDLRMGVFPAVADGEKPVAESDPDAPIVQLKEVPFKAGQWHHLVMTWRNFDSGKSDAVAAFYVDGKRIGQLENRPIAMHWNLERTGIYFAVNYVGLLDELTVFNRPLSAAEVEYLWKHPGWLAADASGSGQPHDGAARRKRSRLADQVAAAGDDPRRTAALRREILALLDSDEGRSLVEPALALAARLPAAGEAPAAPEFPFAADAARKYQRDYAAWRGLPLEVTNRLGMTFVLCPPGEFLMGSPEDEPGHRESPYDETRHRVRLTAPFYLSRHETTVGQFRQFVRATGYATDGEKNGGGHAHDEQAVWKHREGVSWRSPGYAGPFALSPEHPVVHVSHRDAVAFCAWLNRQAGGPVPAQASAAAYGLPTEAQWEWACRAGSGERFWWGDELDTTGKVANVGDRALRQVHPHWPREIMPMNDGAPFAAPVGSYRANAWGLHDMLGNVWEFCSTRYGPYPKGPSIDPGDLDPRRGFAVRGGGWSNAPADVRCATRNADPPHFCHSNLGFRAALHFDAPPK